jgi:hypothetical protein
MPDFYLGCCGRITFRKFGCRVRRIEICDNCCGTVIDWVFKLRTRNARNGPFLFRYW